MSKPSITDKDGNLIENVEDLEKGVEELWKFNIPYAKSRLDAYFYQR
jgi:hypothetical protein